MDEGDDFDDDEEEGDDEEWGDGEIPVEAEEISSQDQSTTEPETEVSPSGETKTSQSQTGFHCHSSSHIVTPPEYPHTPMTSTKKPLAKKKLKSGRYGNSVEEHEKQLLKEVCTSNVKQKCNVHVTPNNF